MAEIDAMAKLERVAGDVSQQRRGNGKGGGKKGGGVDTAPALEDCKPLEVNDETRWKSKAFKEGGGEEGEEEEVDSNEEVMKKSLLILNKLSLTKFDKLSDDFIASGIGRNEECLSSAMVLIVNKAQDEPHFSAMYAQLCLKLSATPMGFEGTSSKKGRKFKKMLLTACQAEFEQDTETKIAKAIEGIDDEEEKVYKAGIIKKHYLGHMTFIGELFKGQLIGIKIMLLCLPMLLDVKAESGAVIDEEKVECFAKLLSTIGYNLEQESEKLKEKGKNDTANELAKCWKKVEIMAGKGKVKGVKGSNRMKFVMEELIEMEENGWVKRRKEETAKTIEEIHKDVRREERQNSSGNHHHGNNNNMRRQASANEMHNMHRRPATAAPSVDKDGFTQISGGGSQGSSFGRSQSMSNMQRSYSDRSLGSSKKPSGIGRTSSGSSFAAFNEPSSRSRPSSAREKKAVEEQQEQPSQETTKEESTPENTFKSPDDCGIKAQNILKEFFVGGDADDAVLSFKELIGAGKEGSVERGAKAVERAILLVLEMKQDDVDKFLTLYSRSFTEKEIETPSIIAGLNDPLEFLTDISIDAPLASNHLITIISKFVTIGAVPFEFLLDSPDYFRTDCGAAVFGCKLLKKMGGDALDSTAHLEVIEKLMTDKDRGEFPSAKELLAKWSA